MEFPKIIDVVELEVFGMHHSEGKSTNQYIVVRLCPGPVPVQA
jgi:hypothetical protein